MKIEGNACMQRLRLHLNSEEAVTRHRHILKKRSKVFPQVSFTGGLRLLFVLALAPAFAAAQGGPPLRTDDPGTPGNKNWEINLGGALDRRIDERRFEVPILDVNYGLGERIQLKFEIPWVVREPHGAPTEVGFGNSLFGVKWRMYENKQRQFSVSTYPQLELNQSEEAVGNKLAERGPRVLLPLEFSKKVGPINVIGEVGYWITGHGPDEWITGLAVGKQATKRLELLGEFYAIGATAGGSTETTGAGGVRYKINSQIALLFMVGRGLREAPSGERQLVGYFGVRFLFPKKHGSAPEQENGSGPAGRGDNSAVVSTNRIKR
jgi:hypothetical protein